MKLVIFGSRTFNNYALMKSIIEETPIYKEGKITEVISGAASGVDALAVHWARSKGIEPILRYANWTKYGKPAGHIRNEVMAKEADCAIGFWDGQSPGTFNMINSCKDLRVPLMVYRIDTGEFFIDIPK